jgi:hypothetical protein
MSFESRVMDLAESEIDLKVLDALNSSKDGIYDSLFYSYKLKKGLGIIKKNKITRRQCLYNSNGSLSCKGWKEEK